MVIVYLTKFIYPHDNRGRKEKGSDTLFNAHICINDENFEAGIVKTIKWDLNK